MFKVGDRVRCIEEFSVSRILTQGKVYTVRDIVAGVEGDTKGVRILDDYGVDSWCLAKRFVLAEDEVDPIMVGNRKED